MQEIGPFYLDKLDIQASILKRFTELGTAPNTSRGTTAPGVWDSWASGQFMQQSQLLGKVCKTPRPGAP